MRAIIGPSANRTKIVTNIAVLHEVWGGHFWRSQWMREARPARIPIERKPIKAAPRIFMVASICS